MECSAQAAMARQKADGASQVCLQGGFGRGELAGRVVEARGGEYALFSRDCVCCHNHQMERISQWEES